MAAAPIPVSSLPWLAPPAIPLPLANRKGRPNGLTHGLTSREATVSGEDPAAFDAYREALLAELRPVGAVEEDVVELMAHSRWKLRRIWRMEQGVHRAWERRLGAEDPLAVYGFLNDCGAEQAWTRLSRFEAQQTRVYFQAEARLRLLQDLRRKGLREAENESRDATAAEPAPSAEPAPTSNFGYPGVSADALSAPTRVWPAPRIGHFTNRAIPLPPPRPPAIAG